MKCGVLTFHRASNFGAVMQAYALQVAIRELGVDSEIIDYRSEFIENHIKPAKWYSYLSPKQMYILLFGHSHIIDNRHNFAEFVKNYIPTSVHIYTADNIKDTNNLYDVFIVGSDQVWSNACAGFDKVYFLDFVNDDKKKNAYSASFGFSQWPGNLEPVYQKLLSSFNHISIREKQGSQLCKEMLGKTIENTLDPVFLMSKVEWQGLQTTIGEDDPYLLVYLIVETTSIFKLAKQIAKEKGLKIIYLSEQLCNHAGLQNKKKITPVEWLSYFMKAEYIVTNSFHGTAFSLIFQKNFSVEPLPSPAKVNSRIFDLLGLTGLQDVITSNNDFAHPSEIDYRNVQPLLDREIAKSKLYLNKLLKDK